MVLVLLILLLLRACMVLLSLDNVAAEHLRILNLNLRIIKNIVVIVDVFDNFNWHLSIILFLWF